MITVCWYAGPSPLTRLVSPFPKRPQPIRELPFCRALIDVGVPSAQGGKRHPDSRVAGHQMAQAGAAVGEGLIGMRRAIVGRSHVTVEFSQQLLTRLVTFLEGAAQGVIALVQP